MLSQHVIYGEVSNQVLKKWPRKTCLTKPFGIIQDLFQQFESVKTAALWVFHAKIIEETEKWAKKDLVDWLAWRKIK